jgi:hypothetical protein
MNPQNNKEIYISLTKNHTESEISEIMHANPRTVRRYAQQTGVKPKSTKFANKTLSEWQQLFDETYNGELKIEGKLYRNDNGHIEGCCICQKCGYKWTVEINHKIRYKTKCIKCDKGNHGNRYDKDTVINKLNSVYAGQWSIVKYGHYSEKDSIIKCNLCGHESTVNLSDFINTTTMRCTNCQTGSFGEYVIANTLLYNRISFVREKTIRINNKKYRLDFLIDNKLGLEYSGLQHFEKGLYYNEKINVGVIQKQNWCKQHGYDFVELKAVYDIDNIIEMLSNVLDIKLEKPTSEFFKANNPDMTTVLNYMQTHSARQTENDLQIPRSRIEKFVKLSGYESISAWQADNKDK